MRFERQLIKLKETEFIEDEFQIIIPFLNSLNSTKILIQSRAWGLKQRDAAAAFCVEQSLFLEFFVTFCFKTKSKNI